MLNTTSSYSYQYFWVERPVAGVALKQFLCGGISFICGLRVIVSVNCIYIGYIYTRLCVCQP